MSRTFSWGLGIALVAAACSGDDEAASGHGQSGGTGGEGGSTAGSSGAGGSGVGSAGSGGPSTGAAAGLSGADSGSTDPEIPQIQGSWTWKEMFSDAGQRVICSDQGPFAITQDGASFSVVLTATTGLCTDTTGSYPNTGTFFGTGTVEAETVTWTDDSDPPFTYTGIITGSPPNRIAGPSRCAGTDSTGTTYDTFGTWEVTR